MPDLLCGEVCSFSAEILAFSLVVHVTGFSAWVFSLFHRWRGDNVSADVSIPEMDSRQICLGEVQGNRSEWMLWHIWHSVTIASRFSWFHNNTIALHLAICSYSTCYGSQILQLPFSRCPGRPSAESMGNVVISPAVISVMHVWSL